MVSPPVLSVVTPALGTGVSGAGSASSRGWATVEIRLLILELLDRRDLAMLLRVERRLTSPVSRLLYREVRPSEAAWMNRMTERHAILCDAVRTLNRNPIPPHQEPHPFRQNKRGPIRFCGPSLAAELGALRAKFPNLRHIIPLRPNRKDDDAYTVLLEGEQVRVELESIVVFDIYTHPNPIAVPPTIPAVLVHEGMDIHHTIAIILDDSDFEEEGDADERDDAVRRWKEWLYKGPLDARVTRIDGDDIGMSLSCRELDGYITRRQATGCEPIRGIELDDTVYGYGDCTVSILSMAARLAPHLRHLSISHSTLSTLLGDLESGIIALDHLYPQLENLTIYYINNKHPLGSDRSGTAMLGLPKLRKLSLCFHRSFNRTSNADITQWVSRIGGSDCLYSTNLIKEPGWQQFNKHIHAAKLRTPQVLDSDVSLSAKEVVVHELDRLLSN